VRTGGVSVVFASPDPAASGPDAAAWTAALDEQGEGLVGLVLAADDLAAASAALGTRAAARDGGVLRLDAAHCHGVPLTLRSAP
jgi:hypothetical protein